MKFEKPKLSAPFDGKWYLLWLKDEINEIGADQHPAMIGRFDASLGRFIQDSGRETGYNAADILGFAEIPQNLKEFEDQNGFSE